MTSPDFDRSFIVSSHQDLDVYQGVSHHSKQSHMDGKVADVSFGFLELGEMRIA